MPQDQLIAVEVNERWTRTPAVCGTPAVDYHGETARTSSSTRRASHAPRARERRDGAKKRQSRSSTDDDSSGDPEPPARRLCAVCHCDISWRHPRATTCGNYCRLRKHRQRKHRRSAPPTESWAKSPYRLFRPPAEPGGLSEREELAARATAGCQCNGGPMKRSVAGVLYVRDDSYVLDATGWCSKCGRERRQGVAPYYLLVWGRMRETETRRPGRSYIRARAFWRHDPKPCEEVVA